MKSEPKVRSSGYSLIEVLVVITIIGVLIALLFAAISQIRGSAQRTACINKLRQLGLGLHQYQSQYQKLPVGHTSENKKNAYPHAGWQLFLLPFIEQDAIYRQAMIDYQTHRDPFSEPTWHSGMSQVIPLFACPADPRILKAQPYVASPTHLAAFTSYLGSCGKYCRYPDGVLFNDSAVRFSEITDGLSNTIFVGERPPSANFRFGWWYAGVGLNYDGVWTGALDMIIGTHEVIEDRINDSGCLPEVFKFQPGKLSEDCDAGHYWSLHAGGANFLFGDASAKFLKYSVERILPALATKAGGETVTEYD
jgi:prepilin-type N-terminal cleavage/methylation domain-containing protein/prepilin-type processing-associated H-X9-DG protein